MTATSPLRLGLIGFPLQHSLSPVLHLAALQACGLKGSYELFLVEPEHLYKLEELVSQVRSGVLHGLNVTIPHKQNILPLVDQLTLPARATRAVNTLWRENGIVVGDNTDSPGFLADLNNHKVKSPGQALVLGGGGAARGVVYALQSAGWQVSLAARNAAQSAALQIDFPGLQVLPLSTQGLKAWRPESVSLVVNASSAGMSPQTGKSPWPEDLPLPSGSFIYDLVYNPAETEFLKIARRTGLDGCNGLGMLVEQAALAFEHWTTSLEIALTCAPRLAMRRAVRLELG